MTMKNSRDLNKTANDEVFEEFLDSCIEGEKILMWMSEFIDNKIQENEDETNSLIYNTELNLYSNAIKASIEKQS